MIRVLTETMQYLWYFYASEEHGFLSFFLNDMNSKDTETSAKLAGVSFLYGISHILIY